MSCLVFLNLFPTTELEGLQVSARSKAKNHEKFWLYLDKYSKPTGHEWWGWTMGIMLDMLRDEHEIDLVTPPFPELSATLEKQGIYQFYFLDIHQRNKHLKKLKSVRFKKAQLQDAASKQFQTTPEEMAELMAEGIRILHVCLSQVDEKSLLVIHLSF